MERIAKLGRVTSVDSTAHLGIHEGHEAVVGPYSTAMHILDALARRNNKRPDMVSEQWRLKALAVIVSLFICVISK